MNYMWTVKINHMKTVFQTISVDRHFEPMDQVQDGKYPINTQGHNNVYTLILSHKNTVIAFETSPYSREQRLTSRLMVSRQYQDRSFIYVESRLLVELLSPPLVGGFHVGHRAPKISTPELAYPAERDAGRCFLLQRQLYSERNIASAVL